MESFSAPHTEQSSIKKLSWYLFEGNSKETAGEKNKREKEKSKKAAHNEGDEEKIAIRGSVRLVADIQAGCRMSDETGVFRVKFPLYLPTHCRLRPSPYLLALHR